METQKDYTQVCVWPGANLGDQTGKDFEEWMLKEFNARVMFAEVVKTLPGNGEEGGRTDLFFYLHKDDVPHFSVPRLQAGIRWWEDVLGNIRADERDMIYSDEVLELYKTTWDYGI